MFQTKMAAHFSLHKELDINRCHISSNGHIDLSFACYINGHKQFDLCPGASIDIAICNRHYNVHPIDTCMWVFNEKKKAVGFRITNKSLHTVMNVPFGVKLLSIICHPDISYKLILFNRKKWKSKLSK
jgi:hypothetical protein